MARRVKAVESAIRMRQRLVDRGQGIKRYGVSTFSGTQMHRYYDSTLIPDDFFRVFNPVKPDKRRRLNPVYDPNFDMYFDTLMDYPTIIQGKLGGRWAGDRIAVVGDYAEDDDLEVISKYFPGR